jgi:trk system potassium uptake protein TrkH
VLVLLFSISLVPPALVAVQFGETQVHTFLNAMLALVAAGVGGLLATRHNSTPLRQRDGFLVVVLFWVVFACGAQFVIDNGVHMRLSMRCSSPSRHHLTGASVLASRRAAAQRHLPRAAEFPRGLGIEPAMALLPYLVV